MKEYKYLWGILSFLVFLFAFWFFCLRTERENRLMNEGDKLVERIEMFRSEKKRLPNTLEELGMEELDGADVLYYTKRDSLHYMLSFGMSLGESKFYYSDTKDWEDKYREMK